MGSNINQQDIEGNSSLHLCLIKYVGDQENYYIYKAIMKAMLKFGASRKIKNQWGQTPGDLLETLEHRIALPLELSNSQETAFSNQFHKF